MNSILASDRCKKITLILILVLSGIVRLWGTDYGLPYYLHPDERIIVDSAVYMAQRHSFEPNNFAWPAHLIMQLSMVFYSLVSFFAFRMPVEEVAKNHRELFYLLSRVITALFGIGTVGLSYLVGSKIKKEIGLISAFLFAFFPIYITHSHYATTDIPTSFLMMIFINIAIRYLNDASYRNLSLMCLITAAFVATKYPGAILCIFIAVVVIIQGLIDKSYSRIVLHGMLAVIMVVFFLFLISPVLFTNFTATSNAITREARSTHLGADGLGWGGNILFYASTYLSYSGSILFLFLIYGIYVFLKRKIGYKFLPLFFGFFYGVLLSYMPLHWERWAVPVYVTPLLLSAIGIYYAFEFLKSKVTSINSTQYIKIFNIMVSITVMNFFVGVVGNLFEFVIPDTRVLSQEYCQENNINDNNSSSEGYTPLNPGRPDNLNYFEESDGIYYLSQNRIENILLSSSMFNRYYAEPDRYIKQINLYSCLDDYYTLENQYISEKRKKSIFEPLNIVYSINYIKNTMALNYVGPDLLFYTAGKQNYIMYNLSDRIMFDDEHKNYDRYYVRGLHSSEADGTWTDGKETEFIFYIDEIDRDVTLFFEVQPLISNNLVYQNIQILINDLMVENLNIREDGTYKIDIRSEIIQDGKLDILFILDDADSPKELSLDNDERNLSLLFKRMWIE